MASSKKKVTSFFNNTENISKEGEAGRKLNETIKRLYSEINKLNGDLKNSNQNILEKDQTINNLKGELNNSKILIDSLTRDLNNIKEEIKGFKELNKSRLSTISDLYKKLETNDKERTKLLERLKAEERARMAERLKAEERARMAEKLKAKNIEKPKEQPVTIQKQAPKAYQDRSLVDVKLQKYNFKLENKLQSSKIALFTSVNGNYIQNAVTCFKSYDVQNPGKFDFYIITSDKLTHKQQDLCDKNRVKILYQNLNSDFKINSDWPYPSECFWIFKGPELFYDMGYKFSMSVDADTYCASPLDFKEFDQITLIGGAIRLNMPEVKNNVVPAKKVKAYDFISKVEKNKDLFKKSFGSFNKNVLSMNSGVLVYNNQNCMSFEFYQHMVDLFKKSKDLGLERKGDDSLLNLFISLNNNDLFNYFGPEWNYYYLFPNQNSNNILKKIKIVHMSKLKPWRYDMIDNTVNQNIKSVIKLWKELENKCTMQEEKDMKVWFYRPSNGYNFGDEITPWLFKKMYNVNIEKPCNPKDENVLLGVGSIMRLANENTEVWGSGIRNIDQADFKGAKKFHAVRGPFTQKRLLELGMQCPPIFGDPGLLLPKFYFPKIEPKYELGIVPHLVDQEIIANKFGKFDNVKIIDLNNKDIEQVVDQFLECKNIVSTSLHGLITAVAYGIPTKWLKASDSINGDDIKFYDFWASLDPRVFTQFDKSRMTVDIEAYQPIWIDRIESPEELISKTNLIPTNKIDLNLLIEKCPYRTKPLISTIMVSYLGDYPGSRTNPVPKFNRAVQSWVDQTLTDRELIIVSDGCELTNREYNANWANNPQIKLLQLPKNPSRWPGSYRQKGVDAATGDWITYLDSDDILLPDYLQGLVPHLGSNHYIVNQQIGQALKGNPINKHGVVDINIIGKPVRLKKPNLPQPIPGTNLYWATRPSNSRSWATHQLIHRRSIPQKWTDQERRGEDIQFSKQWPKPLQINQPGYIICHLNNHLDL
jgi:hypothetical protein